VIVLSAIDTQADRDSALAAGAAAYLNKSQPMSEVMAVARTVMGLDGTATPARAWRPLPTGATQIARPHLSDGERLALSLYADGRTTGQVAREMGVQYETAKTYLRRVREKYGKVGRPTSSRADLIRRAAEDGFLT
jgi:DNA-binding NarL/FixJ family response regulator